MNSKQVPGRPVCFLCGGNFTGTGRRKFHVSRVESAPPTGPAKKTMQKRECHTKHKYSICHLWCSVSAWNLCTPSRKFVKQCELVYQSLQSLHRRYQAHLHGLEHGPNDFVAVLPVIEVILSMDYGEAILKTVLDSQITYVYHRSN